MTPDAGATVVPEQEPLTPLSRRAVRGQGLLIGVAVLWAVALSWHLTRHQVEGFCKEVDAHRVCVERVQTWWNPFGPREDDVRVTVDVDQCGTTYPSPLPVGRPLRPQFRDGAVVLEDDDGSQFVYPAGGGC